MLGIMTALYITVIIDFAAEWQQLRLVVVIHGETRESMILENPYGPGVRRVKKLGYAVSNDRGFAFGEHLRLPREKSL